MIIANLFNIFECRRSLLIETKKGQRLAGRSFTNEKKSIELASHLIVRSSSFTVYSWYLVF